MTPRADGSAVETFLGCYFADDIRSDIARTDVPASAQYRASTSCRRMWNGPSLPP